MKKKILLGALITVVGAGLAFAAGKIEVVRGKAYDFSDEGARTCCPKIKYPNGAATELNAACQGTGGKYWKNPRFVDSAYCETRPHSGGGWKYKCHKLVEADCHR